jgi:hypothetical protein
MPFRSAIAVLLLSVAAVPAADQPQLRTLTGAAPVAGELIGVNAKSVIFKSDGKDVETPLAQVLTVDLAPVPKEPTPKDAKYIDVELTDGTLLHCGQFAIKGKEVQLTLLSGQALKFPLEYVRSYLNEAHDKTFRQDWEKYLGKKINFDQLVVINKSTVKVKKDGKEVENEERLMNAVPVTVGDADAEGKTIEFTLSSGGDKKSKALATIHGIIFKNVVNPGPAPVLCKVFDANANIIVASAVTLEGDRVSVVTPVGVKLELTRAALAKLDYTGGKLVYLSDWDSKKMDVNESSTEDRIDHFRRDKNLDDGPIRLTGHAPFTKGLSIHSRTEMLFHLDGEYREFKAIIGVDELVSGADGITEVSIFDAASGKELHKKIEVSRKDKQALDVTINIQNVKTLRIVVSSPELLDLGHHVDLAEARISK